ncbi:MAG: nucleotide excision repair endonuclease, partial [Polyangiales bacterium]
MSAVKFDRKLGANFLASVPNTPGVYRVFDASGALVYVGKAKSLRRRLSQYRLATRRKVHRKMLAIVELAARIEIETCATDHDARVLEARLIQAHRPRANVDGAYWFLYPFVGLAREATETRFCFTTHADLADGFALHGAYRASEVTWSAFSALMTLLEYVGHRSRARGDS